MRVDIHCILVYNKFLSGTNPKHLQEIANKVGYINYDISGNGISWAIKNDIMTF